MRRLVPVLAVLGLCAVCASGCAATRVVGPPIVAPRTVQSQPVVVVIEPFFENAQMEKRTIAQQYTSWGAVGVPQDVTVYREVQEKPLFAQVAALEVEHRIVIDEVRKLRPQWRVITTGELPSVQGKVRLVRVVVGETKVTGSNRPLHSIATGFGIILWPLLLVNLSPINEVQQVDGMLYLYEADATVVRSRLLRYPTQPDFAVDTRGLPVREQPVGVQVEYEEGLFAPDDRRGPVLLRGFSERLAASVVALVEGL